MVICIRYCNNLLVLQKDQDICNETTLQTNLNLNYDSSTYFFFIHYSFFSGGGHRFCVIHLLIPYLGYSIGWMDQRSEFGGWRW
jgi:hypothetical protein